MCTIICSKLGIYSLPGRVCAEFDANCGELQMRGKHPSVDDSVTERGRVFVSFMKEGIIGFETLTQQVKIFLYIGLTW